MSAETTGFSSKEIKTDILDRRLGEVDRWLIVVGTVLETLQNATTNTQSETGCFERFSHSLQTLIKEMGTERQNAADNTKTADLFCGAHGKDKLNRLFLDYVKRFIDDDYEASAFSNAYGSPN